MASSNFKTGGGNTQSEDTAISVAAPDLKCALASVPVPEWKRPCVLLQNTLRGHQVLGPQIQREVPGPPAAWGSVPSRHLGSESCFCFSPSRGEPGAL